VARGDGQATIPACRYSFSASSAGADIRASIYGEIFYTLKEAQIVIEGWRRHYNTVRPHSSPARRQHGQASGSTARS